MSSDESTPAVRPIGPPLNDPALVDARLTLRDWTSSFIGHTAQEVRDYFAPLELTASTWSMEDEEHPLLRYDCHDFTLDLIFFEEVVVSVNYSPN